MQGWKWWGTCDSAVTFSRASLLWGLPSSLPSSTHFWYWYSETGECPFIFFSIFAKLRSFPGTPSTQQPAPGRDALGMPLKDYTGQENTMSQRKVGTVERHHPKTVGDVEMFSRGMHCFQHLVETSQAKRKQADTFNYGQESNIPGWLCFLQQFLLETQDVASSQFLIKHVFTHESCPPHAFTAWYL